MAAQESAIMRNPISFHYINLHSYFINKKTRDPIILCAIKRGNCSHALFGMKWKKKSLLIT